MAGLEKKGDSYVSPLETVIVPLERSLQILEQRVLSWKTGNRDWIPTAETYATLLSSLSKGEQSLTMIKGLTVHPISGENWQREIVRMEAIREKGEGARAFYESQGFGKSASTSASAPAAKPASTAAAFGPGSAKSAGSVPPAAAMSALSLDPK